MAEHTPTINEIFEQDEIVKEIGKTGQDNPVFEEMLRLPYDVRTALVK